MGIQASYFLTLVRNVLGRLEKEAYLTYNILRYLSDSIYLMLSLEIRKCSRYM